MMAALKDYFCEKLEEEPFSDVEATLWYVVQQIPLALLVALVALLVALLGEHWTPGAMPFEVADAPPDLIQADGNLGEGWYQVCCQLDLYRFVNKDSLLLLYLLGWCKADLAIFLQPCNT